MFMIFVRLCGYKCLYIATGDKLYTHYTQCIWEMYKETSKLASVLYTTDLL